MKPRIKGSFLLALLATLPATTSVGQLKVIVDEFGSGYVWNQGNNSTNFLTYSLGADPTGGLPNWPVLIYNLPFQATPGDVLVRDPFEPGSPILDVLRFDNNSHLIFYSDSIDGFGEPADTLGPPDPFLPNQVFATEQVSSNLFFIDYTPANPGNPQPGWGPNQLSYFFVSDGHVPEPGTASLVMTGLAIFGLTRIRRRRASCGSQASTTRAKKHSLKVTVLASAALLSLNLHAADQSPPGEIGLRIGEQAPAFALKDQNGQEVSLDSLLKKGPVAVVFYRSADWCLFCKFELQHLQRNLKEFAAAGGQVVGISYDSVPMLKRFSDRQKITLALLSDQGSKTIDAYGVRDKTADDPKAGFATHATFVLDQKGIVRAKLLRVIYQEKPGVGLLVKALKDARNAEQKS